MIGIGVGIDYALFVVTRFRQSLADGLTVPEAAGHANATAGQSVVFAGGTVVIAILGLWLTGIPFVGAMGLATAVVVAVAVLAAVTLLPALLIVARRPRCACRPCAAAARAPGRRARLDALGPGHRPARLGLRARGATGAAGAGHPAAGPAARHPDDGTLPTSATQRRAYDLLARGFGPASTAPAAGRGTAARQPPGTGSPDAAGPPGPCGSRRPPTSPP